MGSALLPLAAGLCLRGSQARWGCRIIPGKVDECASRSRRMEPRLGGRTFGRGFRFPSTMGPFSADGSWAGSWSNWCPQWGDSYSYPFFSHPVLPQFGLGGVLDEQMNFTNNYTMTENNAAECQLLVNSSATAPCTVKVVGIAGSNQNNVTTGKPGYKTGQRVVTFSAKFYF